MNATKSKFVLKQSYTIEAERDDSPEHTVFETDDSDDEKRKIILQEYDALRAKIDARLERACSECKNRLEIF